MADAIHILKTGVESLSPWLQPDGELHDPVFNAPTQYGTPYYAYCNAILASHLGEEGSIYRQRAWRGLQAALAYVLNTTLPPRISSADRETGETWGINHRDFFWPPILKTYRLLKQWVPAEIARIKADLAAVRVEASFAQRPPNNWASVWLSGEWLRYQEGCSPYSLQQIDTWLGAFFHSHILLDQGFYMEPGLPNSYDLFTRYHLADMLLHGYDGVWKNEMERLMQSGLKRSLAVQLSDGSLASAHRSTGQTWTLGAQCAYFRMAAAHFKERNPDLASQAERAAGRAFSAFMRYQRPSAPFSPVENLLPPNFRVGYEQYTADGHYSSLALAFLAAAIEHGLHGVLPDLEPRTASVFIEHNPTFRTLIHRGPYSLQINLAPASHYDAFGLTDLTFGPNRTVQFVSSVQATGTDRFYNIGLALRSQPGQSQIEPISHMQHDLIQPVQPLEGSAGVLALTHPRGCHFEYAIQADIKPDGVWIQESTPGLVGLKTLLIPYLRDAGTGVTTQVILQPNQVLLTNGTEKISFTFDSQVEHMLDLPHGYENRRGLCGLLRIDFRDPSDQIRYHIKIVD